MTEQFVEQASSKLAASADSHAVDAVVAVAAPVVKSKPDCDDKTAAASSMREVDLAEFVKLLDPELHPRVVQLVARPGYGDRLARALSFEMSKNSKASPGELILQLERSLETLPASVLSDPATAEAASVL